MVHAFYSSIFTILLLFILTACAPVKSAVKERYFWPPPPSEPKIEWLGNYTDERDLKSNVSVLDLLTGEKSESSLHSPFYLTSDSEGKVVVGDLKAKLFWVLDFNTKTMAQLGDSSMAGVVESPSGVGFGPGGLVYAADNKARKIYVVDKNSNKLIKVLDVSSMVTSIASLVIDIKKGRIIIPDSKANIIAVFSLQGDLQFKFGEKGEGNGQFNLPLSVTINSKGEMLVADSFNARIQKFTSDGTFITSIGQRASGIGGLDLIKAVAVDSDDNIYVTDARNHYLTIFSPEGEVLMVLGGKYAQMPSTPLAVGGFLLPQGIYIDNNNKIYIADMMNHRIQVYQYITDNYLKSNPVKSPVAVPPKSPGVK